MAQAVRQGLLVLALVAIGLALGLGGTAAADPFADRPSAPAAEAPGAQHAWGPVAVVGRALLTFQREANRLIGEHMRAIREGTSSTALLIGIGLAFLYGVVHALGPGHGKLVVVSYFLSRDARVGRGLLMGLQIAIFHVLSAMVVVALANLLLRRAFGGAPAEVAGVRLFSYGLIAVIGAVMLVQAVRRPRQRQAGVQVDGCCGGAHDNHDHGHDSREQAQQGALSLGVGLVPCAGAVLILLYAVANDILFAGMLLVAAIAARMAITMAGLGILSVIVRQVVASRVEAGAGSNGRLATLADYAGGLAIMAIGAGLFWAAL